MNEKSGEGGGNLKRQCMKKCFFNKCYFVFIFPFFRFSILNETPGSYFTAHLDTPLLSRISGEIFDRLTSIDIQLSEDCVHFTDSKVLRSTKSFSLHHKYSIEQFGGGPHPGVLMPRLTVRFHPNLPIYCTRNSNLLRCEIYLSSWADQHHKTTFRSKIATSYTEFKRIEIVEELARKKKGGVTSGPTVKKNLKSDL